MLKKGLFILSILFISFLFSNEVFAQCSMCTVNAEQSIKNGNSQGAGLNTGILYLLAIPYLLILVIGIVWYKKYRKKSIGVDVNNHPLNIN